MLTKAKTLDGYELHARDGVIGTIKDLYFDDEQWQVRYFVVHTDAWLGGRTVLITPPAVMSRANERALSTDLTKDQVRNSPDVDTQRQVSRRDEERLHQHYAWPFYWTPATALGTSHTAPISPGNAPSTVCGIQEPALNPRTGTRMETPIEANMRESGEGDPHLRSADAVRGYHIEANDGAIGHVEDLLIDEAGWSVRYVIVDTKNWWPGKKVLVPLSAVVGIDQPTATMRVDLTREELKSGPEFDADRPIAADYTDRLDAHYGRIGQRRTTSGAPPAE